jgi:hypothetical protein
MPCPNYPIACSSLTSIQYLLNPNERSQLSAKAAPYGDNALRCLHCRLVYTGINPVIRLGYLNNGFKGPGFQPAPDYA